MWMSRGKYSGQKGQKVHGPCGRSVSGVFQKCQGDSARPYKPWKWKILEVPEHSKPYKCYYLFFRGFFFFFLVPPFQEPQQDGEKG